VCINTVVYSILNGKWPCHMVTVFPGCRSNFLLWDQMKKVPLYLLDGYHTWNRGQQKSRRDQNLTNKRNKDRILSAFHSFFGRINDALICFQDLVTFKNHDFFFKSLVLTIFYFLIGWSGLEGPIICLAGSSKRVLVFPSVLFSFVLVFCKKKQKVFFEKPSVLDWVKNLYFLLFLD
jgi:hypothetical protein